MQRLAPLDKGLANLASAAKLPSLQTRAFRSWPSPQMRFRPSMDGDTVIKGLIGTNVVGWLLWQSNPSFMRQHAMVSVESVSHLRLHTLVTSAFSHFDGWHLAGNMFALYFFGGNVGQMLGGKRLLQLYLAGAIVSSLAHIGSQLWYNREIPKYFRAMPGALGASGAVNACVILSVLVQPTATVLLYGIIPLPAWLFGGLWLLYDLRGAVSQAPGVAYAGHLGGAAVGGLYYLRLRRFLR
ncbi:hypothetical protein WJX73_006756 [Symbiochloris irregularis]|uniref:Peptidase S54 rhomboid domain-containing protein n=1 Tax=Symbiochloris irregularis TaxID=706552 RepID=A0AAW1PF50_9CHLO